MIFSALTGLAQGVVFCLNSRTPVLFQDTFLSHQPLQNAAYAVPRQRNKRLLKVALQPLGKNELRRTCAHAQSAAGTPKLGSKCLVIPANAAKSVPDNSNNRTVRVGRITPRAPNLK